MIDVPQFNELVIVPALKAINLYSPAAAELLLGTALQESRLQYLKQIGKGPALGLFQMEPATHNDIWDNYLGYRKELAAKVLKLGHSLQPAALATDLLYAAAMCRVHYRRAPDRLPEQGDYEAQAEFYKRIYNTYEGAATVDEYLENWYAHSGVRAP